MKAKHNFWLWLLLAVVISLGLVSCFSTSLGSVQGASTPTKTALSAQATLPADPQIPAPTVNPPAILNKVGTLGKGVLPQILRTKDGKKIFISDGYSLRILNAADNKQEAEISLSDGERLGPLSSDGSLFIKDTVMGFIVLNTAGQVVGGGSGGTGTAVGPVFTQDNRYVVYLATDRMSGGPYYKICLINLVEPSNNDDVRDPENGPCYPTISFPLQRYDTMTYPAVSPDGKWVAAGYTDSTRNILYIWDLEKKTILHEIIEQPSRINSVAFSPDGLTLASAGDDGLVRFWNPISGQPRRVVSGFLNKINGISFSADGKQLIVDVADHPQVAYELETEKITLPTPETPDPIAAPMLMEGYMLTGGGSKISFSPDGTTLAVGHGSLQIWDMASRTLRTAIIPEKTLNLAGMTYSPDGNHLAVVTYDGDVYVWNIQTGRQEFSVSANILPINQALYVSGGGGIGLGVGAKATSEQNVAFSADAGQLALGNGAMIELWDVKTNRKILDLAQTTPPAYPTKISFSEDGTFIYAVVNRNEDVVVWNAKTGELVRRLELPGVDSTAFTAIDIQGELFARNNYDGNYSIEIWNITSGKMTKIVTQIREMEPLRFSADGKYLAAISNQKQLYIWRVDTGQLIYISDENLDVGDVAIGPEGKFLASAKYGQTILMNLESVVEASFQTGFTSPELKIESPDLPFHFEHPIIPTLTPQPTIIVNPLPVSTLQVGAIHPDNVSQLHLLGRLGNGLVSQLSWPKDEEPIRVVSSHGFYQINPSDLKEKGHFELDAFWPTNAQGLPDGRSLVSGFTQDGKVQVWDAVEEKLLVDVKGSGQSVISPDGHWLVYAAGDQDLHLWNIETGRAGIVLHSSSYPGLPVFSPDGRYVAAIRADRSVCVWDIQSGVIVNVVGGSEADLTDIQFSLDGKYLVGAAAGAAWKWSVEPGLPPFKLNFFEGEVKENLTLFTDTVTSVAVSADNTKFAVGTSERKIWLYDLATGKMLGNLSGDISVPQKLAFSPDGLQLVSVDSDGRMVLWNNNKQESIVSSYDFSGRVLGMVALLDGKFATWTQNLVRTFDVRNLDQSEMTYIPAKKILAVSPVGNLAAGYDPFRVSLYDVPMGELKKTLPDEAEDVWVDYHDEGDIIRQFYGALFSSDGKQLITYGTGGLWIYTSLEGTLVNRLEWNNIRRAALSSDGNWLVASSYNLLNTPKLYDVKDMKVISETGETSYDWGYPAGEDYVPYAISPDKIWVGMLRYGSEQPDGLRLMDVATGVIPHQVEFKDAQPMSLAFNPAVSLIAVGLSDGTIYWVDMTTFEVIYMLKAHPGSVTPLVFSPDGRLLLSAGSDGIVKVWGVP